MKPESLDSSTPHMRSKGCGTTSILSVGSRFTKPESSKPEARGIAEGIRVLETKG